MLDEEFPFPIGEDVDYFGETPGDDEYDIVPGYGDEEELLGYSDEDLAAIEPPRSRRGPLAVAALVAIAVIGGIVVLLLRSGGSSEPPQIITADASPTKIAPEDAGASEADGQSKQIYDRIDPQSEVADSQLVVSGDEPVAEIPPIPEDTSANDVSRVILGGGPAADSPQVESDTSPSGNAAQDGGTTIASSSSEPAPIGPKKVRTVVVRPDGTIVSSEAVAEGAESVTQERAGSASQTGDSGPALAELPPASETPPAPAADENPLLSENFSTEVIENPPAENPPTVSVPDIPAPAPVAPPTPVVRPPTPNPTVMTTTSGSSGPIDVTPAGPAPQASSGLGGGFLVQVSSQRSREVALATFAELQQRYPGILGDRAPDIQRADLGERGVYYRVRVGYPTREEAVRMCDNLKAAGGDCLLATR